MLRMKLFRYLSIGASLALCSATAAHAAPLPSYATSEESIKGTISSVPSKYKILVRDDRGYVDDVTLHDGTVINPTGLTLAPGQTVTILGRNAGSTFRANQIDTPYSERSGITYAYPYITDNAYGAPYAYGYPYDYGYPYNGGLSLGLYFGSGYYGRGYYGHGGHYGGRGYYGHGYNGRGGYGHGGFYGGRGYGGRGNAGRTFPGGAPGRSNRGGAGSGRSFGGGSAHAGGGGHGHR